MPRLPRLVPRAWGQKANPVSARGREGVFRYKSLTMTYFHTGICTIIGAKSFHGPVRDGKGWDRLAMVVRHNGLLRWPVGQRGEFIESIVYQRVF